MERATIHFPSGGITLEGIVDDQPGDRAVLIAHPHPLYGGSMHNDVVKTVARAYQAMGFGSLRFNFRGVEGSEGHYDEGIGEQDDVKGGLEYLLGLGKRNLHLAGYSFGAGVIASGIEKYSQASRVILISPPVNLMSFDVLKGSGKVDLVIVGEQDSVADAETIRTLVPLWNREALFRMIPETDHFFSGQREALEDSLVNFLRQMGEPNGHHDGKV
jgi:alpha/beta superfamily hydrolase